MGESYVPLGGNNFSKVINDIKLAKPDVIFNTVNGASNLSLFQALRAAKIYPKAIPTISFSIFEDEITKFETAELAGNYFVWNYLQSLDNKSNQGFVAKFKARYGENRSIGNPMATTYAGVMLWAKAVERAGTIIDVHQVRLMASDMSMQGSESMMYIDPKTQHTWKPMHIVEITEQKQLKIVWFSNAPVAPKPFPETRSEEQWFHYLNQLQKSWNGSWHAEITLETNN